VDFDRDAGAGRLAPINHVDPSFFANDDHPPLHPSYAQQLIAAVYTALADSPIWDRCLFVVTYDENGGFFDHVPPPTTVDDQAALGFGQMGFRVPTIVAGPYVKQGVSSVVLDHCSVLAYIERRFGLEPLNQRTRAANDLSSMIDTERLRLGLPNPPIQLPAVEIDESMLGADCTAAKTRLDEHPMHQLANQYPELFVGYDNRAHVRDELYLIGDFLEQHNAGRIRRGR
jgi:phospholipase C